MADTTHTLAGLLAFAIQGRTDLDAEEVTDIGGAELRLLARLFTPGVVDDSFAVTPTGGMVLTVGGHAKGDVAVIEGNETGQGNYLLGTVGSFNVTVPASDPSQHRTDELFLVVLDDPYDGSGVSAAVLGYRTGDPGGGAPGPDPSWTAYLQLATISVPSGTSSLSTSNLTDRRNAATPIAHGHAWTEITGKPDLALADHNHDTRYALLGHGHNASDITSGTLSTGRLPKASLSGQGIVQLSNAINSDAENQAATSKAVKAAYDAAQHAHPYASTSHNHSGEDITSGTISAARLPSATTSARGAVQLNDGTTSTSTTTAATANAVKKVNDAVNSTRAVMYGTGSPAGRRVFIQSGTPSATGNGDIWFKI